MPSERPDPSIPTRAQIAERLGVTVETVQYWESLPSASDGISAREASSQLGVTVQTVTQWVRSGILPATYFGKKLAIHPDAVAAMRRPAVRRPA